MVMYSGEFKLPYERRTVASGDESYYCFATQRYSKEPPAFGVEVTQEDINASTIEVVYNQGNQGIIWDLATVRSLVHHWIRARAIVAICSWLVMLTSACATAGLVYLQCNGSGNLLGLLFTTLSLAFSTLLAVSHTSWLLRPIVWDMHRQYINLRTGRSSLSANVIIKKSKERGGD